MMPARKPDGRAAIASLGVKRLDDFAQRNPGNDAFHGLQELVAPRGFAIAVKALLFGQGQSLLFHLHTPASDAMNYASHRPTGDLISVA